MEFKNYSGIVCGFQFSDSLNLELIRLELEIEFNCQLKLVSKRDILSSNGAWDKNLSNVFFLCSSSDTFPEKLLNEKALTKFLEKYKLYVICVYDKGTFFHHQEVQELVHLTSPLLANSIAYISLLSTIKILARSVTASSRPVFNYLEKTKN